MVKPAFNFKIVLFGNKGVGRSTLLKYTSGSFIEDTRILMGLVFRVKELFIENTRVKLIIHDIYHELGSIPNLLPGFIKNSRASFLMFDITSVSSLNFLTEIPVFIRKYAGDIPIWLVGNKLDLEEAREVSGEDAEIFARDNDLMGYVEISAKSGQGCDELFERIGRFLYKSYKDLVGKEEEEMFIRKKKKKQKKKTLKE